MKYILFVFSIFLYTGCSLETDTEGLVADNMDNTVNTRLVNSEGEIVPEGNLSPAGANFLRDAKLASMMHEEMAEAGQGNTRNAEVRAFAGRMEEDHESLIKKLTAIGEAKAVLTPKQLESEHESEIKSLVEAEVNFDRIFLDRMIREHQASIDLYESASADVLDRDILVFIETTLPVLRKHMNEAQRLRDSI